MQPNRLFLFFLADQVTFLQLNLSEHSNENMQQLLSTNLTTFNIFYTIHTSPHRHYHK